MRFVHVFSSDLSADYNNQKCEIVFDYIYDFVVVVSNNNKHICFMANNFNTKFKKIYVFFLMDMFCVLHFVNCSETMKENEKKVRHM